MRIWSSIIFLFILSTSFSISDLDNDESSGVKKVLSAQKVVFLGVNFSKLKLLNEEGFVGKNGKTKCGALKFKYFLSWNEVFIQEESKFNLEKLLHVKEHELYLEPTEFYNEQIVTENCIIDDLSYRVSKQEIQEIVNQYIDVIKDDICVLMIGESLSKKLGLGVFTIVYFDPFDGTILLSNRYEEAPVGYGFDNYWVNCIHKSLEDNAKFIKKSRKTYGIR
jgi:hypothetical protein